MPNGKPGDHPLTDILVHKRPTFTPEIDHLVRQLKDLGCGSELARIEWFNPPPLPELERKLAHLVAIYREQRRDEGWEI
jgi:hypothetical protein